MIRIGILRFTVNLKIEERSPEQENHFNICTRKAFKVNIFHKLNNWLIVIFNHYQGYGLNVRPFLQKEGNMNWIKKGHEDEWLILYTFMGFNSEDVTNRRKIIKKDTYFNKNCMLNPQVLINEGVILFDNPYDAELYFE